MAPKGYVRFTIVHHFNPLVKQWVLDLSLQQIKAASSFEPVTSVFWKLPADFFRSS